MPDDESGEPLVSGDPGCGVCGVPGCGVSCSCGAPTELNAGKRTRGVDGVQGVARGFMPGRVGVGVKGTATASWWASRTSSSSRGVSSVPGSSRICTSMAAASLDPRALGSGRGVRCAPRCIAANRPRDGPRGAPRPSEAFPERAELSWSVLIFDAGAALRSSFKCAQCWHPLELCHKRARGRLPTAVMAPKAEDFEVVILVDGQVCESPV